MKVAVVGSRGLGGDCYSQLCQAVPGGASEIVSGGAVGADRLAERYAAENNLKMTIIRPDYAVYDRQAPLIRNRQIVEAADYVVVLWDGQSRGTLNVIMTCLNVNKPVKILMFR